MSKGRYGRTGTMGEIIITQNRLREASYQDRASTNEFHTATMRVTSDKRPL